MEVQTNWSNRVLVDLLLDPDHNMVSQDGGLVRNVELSMNLKIEK